VVLAGTPKRDERSKRGRAVAEGTRTTGKLITHTGPTVNATARGRRVRYLLLAAGTIALGLLVHIGEFAMPARLRDFTGDALWAVMMVWWVGVAWPAPRPVSRAAIAVLVCFAVESSQLYHAPWLDALRATTPGHLVLGSSFDARDLLAYALAVCAAMLLDHRLHPPAGIRSSAV